MLFSKKKRLQQAVKEVTFPGNAFEKQQLNLWRERQIDELDTVNKRLIRYYAQIHKHQPRLLLHLMLVAKDVEYIAAALNLPSEKRRALRIAALLHDVGKLDVHELLLDLSNQKVIYKHYNKEPVPDDNLSKFIRVQQVVEYLSKDNKRPRLFMWTFKRWLKKKKLFNYWDRSVYDYLKYHQTATKRYLEKLHLDPEIVELAATHHPTYFDLSQKKIEPEALIIEIADKFNAMIQSEGGREYAPKLTKLEALNTIWLEHAKEFENHEHSQYGNKVVVVLVRRYLENAVKTEMFDEMKRMRSYFDHGNLTKTEWELAHDLRLNSLTVEALESQCGVKLSPETKEALTVYKLAYDRAATVEHKGTKVAI